MPPGVEVKAGDAYDAEQVRRLSREATVVYQCAQPPYTEWPAKFPLLQKAIVEGVAMTRAKLVIAENLYMYGDTQGRVITETTPLSPHGAKGRTRALMTQAALAAHHAGKVRVAIGRGSDFFGPHVTASAVGAGIFQRLVDGRPAQVMGDPDVPHSYTYVGDFGESLATLGEREEALGHVWHVPNDSPVTARRFVEMVAKEAGRAPRMQVAGPVLLGLIGLLNREVRELWEMRYEFEKPYVVDSSRFEMAFGMQATPIEEAIRQAVAWYVSGSSAWDAAHAVEAKLPRRQGRVET
jgi:nucleoside-diphosphate-sugar epimerase